MKGWLFGSSAIGGMLLLQATPVLSSNDDVMVDILKTIATTSPALLILAIQIWFNHQNQTENGKREDVRDARMAQERAELTKEFSVTVRESFAVVREQGLMLRDIAQLIRQGEEQHVRIIEKIDHLSGQKK